MKRLDFFARLGADPQPYGVYGKGMQRRMAEKTPFNVIVLAERTTSNEHVLPRLRLPRPTATIDAHPATGDSVFAVRRVALGLR